MPIGVLALQGGFAAHVSALREIGLDPREVRSAADLEGCDGLVLPGGESPTQLRLIEEDPALSRELTERVRAGVPVLGTCAGLILAAARVEGPAQRSFGWIDVAVRRNAWGRQLHSGEAIADDGETALVLIRAPRIERVGARASVELTLDGEPVLVREGSRWGATFHPELTRDRRLYARVFGGTASYSSSSSPSSSSSCSASCSASGSIEAALSISSSQNSRH